MGTTPAGAGAGTLMARVPTIAGGTRRLSVCLAVAPIFTALVTEAARAQVSERDSLKGLDRLMVIVEQLHEDADEIDLDADTLQESVEGRLKNAGIGLLTGAEREADARQPYLYLNVNVIYVPQLRLVTFSLDIEIHQLATLKNGDEALALTWAKSYLGIQSQEHAAERIEETVENYTDIFIREWILANRPPEIAEEHRPG